MLQLRHIKLESIKEKSKIWRPKKDKQSGQTTKNLWIKIMKSDQIFILFFTNSFIIVYFSHFLCLSNKKK